MKQSNINNTYYIDTHKQYMSVKNTINNIKGIIVSEMRARNRYEDKVTIEKHGNRSMIQARFIARFCCDIRQKLLKYYLDRIA